MNQEVKIKKRYNNQAEIRSYLFDRIKAEGNGIKFLFVNSEGETAETMTIPHEELNRGFVTAQGIKSKVNAGQTFDLISFKWESDEERNHRLAGRRQMTIFDIIPEMKKPPPDES